jgi:hypothetical protein
MANDSPHYGIGPAYPVGAEDQTTNVEPAPGAFGANPNRTPGAPVGVYKGYPQGLQNGRITAPAGHDWIPTSARDADLRAQVLRETQKSRAERGE